MKKTIITALLAILTLAANAQLLFRINGNGLAAPSYIVGTYHIVDDSFVDPIAGIRQALADWLTKMPGIMNEKPTLFAVGAGHLLGENGVLNLLYKAGYTVEPVQ